MRRDTTSGGWLGGWGWGGWGAFTAIHVLNDHIPVFNCNEFGRTIYEIKFCVQIADIATTVSLCCSLKYTS